MRQQSQYGDKLMKFNNYVHSIADSRNLNAGTNASSSSNISWHIHYYTITADSCRSHWCIDKHYIWI